jgi:riboflavin synthase
MFTGIIEHTGTVKVIKRKSHGIAMEIGTEVDDLGLKKGSSVAINGVCVTATDVRKASFLVDVVRDTLTRTNLGSLKPRDRVNIELPLAMGDRLDGHILEGHADGTATIVSLSTRGIQTSCRIKLPAALCRYVVENGSIGIDGISLTVKELRGTIMTVTLIPFTIEKTTLSKCRAGDRVNIEVDRMGKYLEKQLGKNK